MIEATYTVTQAEFSEAQKLWCPQVARKIPGYWPMQIAGMAFGACLGWSIIQLPAKLGLPLAGTFILYLVVLQWRKRAARKYQYEVKNDVFEAMTVRFDNEGYHDHKNGQCGGWISWAGFTGWRETETIFVIGRGLMFITVPKWPLSVEQQEVLREMFRSRIESNS